MSDEAVDAPVYQLRRRTVTPSPSRSTPKRYSVKPKQQQEEAPVKVAESIRDSSENESADEDHAMAFARAVSSADTTFRTGLFHSEKPRQILFLCLTIVVVLAIGLGREAEWALFSGLNSVQTAFITASIVFLIYCILQVRDGLMVNPHPAFWRVAHGITVIYIVFLAALLVMDLEDARKFFRSLIPGIPESLEQDGMGGLLNCEITASTLYRQVTSQWFTSHLLGWFGHVLIFRDIKLTFAQSMLFELLELTLLFWIPEFKECWWDSLFLDKFGSNLIGMYLGYKLMEWWKLPRFSWTDDHWGHGVKHGNNAKSLQRSIKLAANRFLPFSWSDYRWQWFSSFNRCMWFIVVMFGDNLLTLNSFFLFHIFNIPNSHVFNKIRLSFVALLAFTAISELHAYVDGKTRRIGQNLYLIMLLALVETLTIVKHARHVPRFQTLPPLEVVVPWLIAAFFFSIWLLVYYGYHPSPGLQFLPFRKFVVQRRVIILQILFVPVFVPLLSLLRGWVV